MRIIYWIYYIQPLTELSVNSSSNLAFGFDLEVNQYRLKTRKQYLTLLIYQLDYKLMLHVLILLIHTKYFFRKLITTILGVNVEHYLFAQASSHIEKTV